MALGACTPSSDVPAAEQGIAAFHSDLNAGNLDKIYDGSGADLKTATSKERFGQILTAVHSKLGLFKNGKSVGWNDNATTGGHFVAINYEAAYQKGSAAENFVFRIDGKQAALVGYHVNSDALLLN
jgi:hypothetical protein